MFPRAARHGSSNLSEDGRPVEVIASNAQVLIEGDDSSKEMLQGSRKQPLSNLSESARSADSMDLFAHRAAATMEACQHSRRVGCKPSLHHVAELTFVTAGLSDRFVP